MQSSSASMSSEPDICTRRGWLSLTLGVLAVIVVPAAILLALYYTPRHELASYYTPQSEEPQLAVRTYHGLGWHEEPGYMGKNWITYRRDEDDGCYWEIDLREYGYSHARGYYPSGVLMEESECKTVPDPDRHDVRNGRYFDPNGKLVSEIINGTGRQTLFYAEGTVRCVLDLKVGSRVELTWHSSSGHVILHCRYDENERFHGPHIINHQDGTPKWRYRFEHGNEIGNWYLFHPDGTIKEIGGNGTSPPSEFAAGERHITADELAAVERD
jgi:hypothetical protein